MQGTLGVHSAIQQRGSPNEKKLDGRLIECRNSHGVIGQVFVESLERWSGECPDCGDSPQEKQWQ
jgi:hypothetical protein